MVFGVQSSLVDAADHQHRRAQNHQRPQRLGLCRGQRPHRVERPDRRQGSGRLGTLMAQQGRDGDGQFGHRPRPHEIAEVDQAVGQTALAQDDVVSGDVTVDHLNRQVVDQGSERVPGRRGGRLHGGAAVVVADVPGQRPHGAHAVPQIPLQHPVHPGVVEAGQRPAGSSGQIAECGHPAGTQIGVAAEGAAGKVADDPREKPSAVAVPVTDLGDRGSPGGLEIGCRADVLRRGDERRRRVLGLQFDAAERRVGDLEHPDRAAGVVAEQKVGVLLAAQRDGLRGQAELGGGDLCGPLGRHRRHRQLSGLKEVEQCHEFPRGSATSLYRRVTVSRCER